MQLARRCTAPYCGYVNYDYTMAYCPQCRATYASIAAWEKDRFDRKMQVVTLIIAIAAFVVALVK